MSTRPTKAAGHSPAPTQPTLELGGSLWLHQGNHWLGGADNMALLEAIHQTGSMTQAAKLVGISYKTAWDRVHDMNNVAGQTLVERSAGGTGGGGTVLTNQALALIEAFRHIERAHARILAQLAPSLTHPLEVLQTLSTLGLRTSARNQLSGTVKRVHQGDVEALVELSLPHAKGDKADRLWASLTMGSVKALKLAKGAQAVALFKAPSVQLALLDEVDAAQAPAARNQWLGQVTAIHVSTGKRQTSSSVTEVQVRLQGGQTVVATVPAEEVTQLALQAGAAVIVQVHETAVILGVA